MTSMGLIVRRARAAVKQVCLVGLTALASASVVSCVDDANRSVTRDQAALSISETLGDRNAYGFARALVSREFSFPRDHGPHSKFKNEWWYFTGNLQTDQGRHFGFQLTFFRLALTPTHDQRHSRWGTNQVFVAHFTVTDIANEQFYNHERISRGALDLAGASSAPLRIWLEDWFVEASDRLRHSVPTMRLHAAEANIAIDLEVAPLKPVVLQGDRGLSRKSADPGNASYYYSVTKLHTQGVILVDGEQFKVSGFSWMDREWSTSALAKDQVGWDWFGLQLSDGRELMFYRIRRRNGGTDPFSRGVIVDVDGSTQTLTPADINIQVRDQWRSPKTEARYPSRWHIQIASLQLDLDIRPYVSDQELDASFRYWEGAVSVTGSTQQIPIAGSGYVELVGYSGLGADG